MTITAKFPGTCPACGGYITPGERVEWSKGQRARHLNCSVGRSVAPATQAPADAKQVWTWNQPAKAPTKRCWECGCPFSYADARANPDSDWSESYCGC
jgi:hypothetical protein